MEILSSFYMLLSTNTCCTESERKLGFQQKPIPQKLYSGVFQIWRGS